jgi:hypothetical protein
VLLAGLGPAPYDPDRLLAVEATLREIDACFAADALPASLATVRERLVGVVESRPVAAAGP